MKKQLITLMLAAATAATSWAVPARRGFVSATGPDGKPIAVQLVGDEFGHYHADSDGRMLERRGDRYEYVSAERQELVMAARQERFEARNSAIAARRAAARRNVPAQIGTFPNATFPCTGKQKAIVILVEFQDQKFELGDHAHDYFTDMLNKKGFSEYKATGCVNEYFIDSSNGQFDCQFDLYGPVTMKYNMAHYGGNDAYGNDKAPEEMVIEACQQLDATVNFADYDRDNNGVIDNIYIIYAGRGEASDLTGEYENTIWPHSWDVSQYNKRFDGKKLATYGCSNEWEDIWGVSGGKYVSIGGRPDGIGTFVHEFSHVMGLPDLYHTTSSSADYTPGEWSVLDYGPYNNNGRTPPAYSAFERNALGWIELTELTAKSGDVTIPELNSSNTACCITNPKNAQEFFLLECRAQKGWDKYLPGKGMLVWHIDYNASVWSSNAVNNTKSHQYVDLVEADGIASKTRSAADAFPGTKKITEYTPKWWDKNEAGFKIENIALGTNGNITFHVDGGEEVGGGDEENPDNDEYITVADVIASSLDGSKVTVRGYVVGFVKGAFSATGVHFSAEDCTETTNIVLADDVDECNYSFCIPVQLPKGDVRDQLNLQANPDKLGCLIDIEGTMAAYFNKPGLRSATAWRLIEEAQGGDNNGGDQDSITEIEGSATTVNMIYDLSGRRVTGTMRPGLYIINGKKTLIR